MMLKQH